MENLKEKLFSLATNDYQNRRGQYPTGGVPDTIDVFERNSKVFIAFSFKNTSEISADRWVRNYLKNKIGVDPINIDTYQDGDYQNDWVVSQAKYLIEEEKVNEPVKVEKPNVEKKVKKVKNESKEEKTIYGIKVSKGINQTLIWKVLKKVYENKDEEGIKIVKELKIQYPEIFENAVKCLVSKKRINYINSIC
ncbi:MAG: hypothetical protein SOZ95_01065 [Bacilli bacterium]|nr:hypothetical protein [Bacilli bacterium]